MKIREKEVIVTMVPEFSVDFHGKEICIPNHYKYDGSVYIAVDMNGDICLYAAPPVLEVYDPKLCELGGYFQCSVEFSEAKKYLNLGFLTEEEMARMPVWSDSCIKVEMTK